MKEMKLEQVPEKPDCIWDAIKRYEREGEQGIDWEWFYILTPEQRKEFDEWLVADKHPLAYEAGTPESRFRRVIKELADELKYQEGKNQHD